MDQASCEPPSTTIIGPVPHKFGSVHVMHGHQPQVREVIVRRRYLYQGSSISQAPVGVAVEAKRLRVLSVLLIQAALAGKMSWSRINGEQGRRTRELAAGCAWIQTKRRQGGAACSSCLARESI